MSKSSDYAKQSELYEYYFCAMYVDCLTDTGFFRQIKVKYR